MLASVKENLTKFNAPVFRSEVVEKILVIDDNEMILYMVKKSLEKDYQVFSYPGPLLAFECLEQHYIDLIIVDIQMPDMDGYEFCAKIKETNSTGHIPVIIMSAKGGVNSRSLAYKLGAINYIEKPFEVNELKALVASVLRQTKSNNQSDILEYGDLVFDSKSFYCGHENGDFQLTKSESQILEQLIEHADETVARARLSQIVGHGSEHKGRSIDTHISSLRKKIKYSQVQIRSIYGEGYRLEKIKKVA